MPFQKGNPGRPKGATNKVTAEIKTVAQQHGPQALRTLVRIMNSKNASDRDRIAASKEILERAYGKSSQEIILPPASPVNVQVNNGIDPRDYIDAFRSFVGSIYGAGVAAVLEDGSLQCLVAPQTAPEANGVPPA